MNQTIALTLTVKSTGAVFTFSSTEVPEQISIGGKQMLHVHKMPGGLRVIDAMGPDDKPLSWGGLFWGPGAVDRARQLDNIRRSGSACTVNWDVFQYSVVIAEFEADYERQIKIPYRIFLEIAQDETQTIQVQSGTSPSDALNQDSATMTQLAGAVGNPAISVQAASVSTALNSVTTAAQPLANGLVSLSAPALGPQIGQVSTLSTAATSSILAASAPLAALQSGVQAQITASEATVSSLPTLGYINPSMPMPAQVQALIAQGQAAVQLPSLYELSAVTTRMTANLALVASPSGNNQVVIGGGNLYQLAAQQYGDATRWTDIAQASGISDPMTPGFNTVTIPQ